MRYVGWITHFKANSQTPSPNGTAFAKQAFPLQPFGWKQVGYTGSMVYLNLTGM